MLRAAIFNDGENFRHTICDLFAQPKAAKVNPERIDPERPLFYRDNYLPQTAVPALKVNLFCDFFTLLGSGGVSLMGAVAGAGA